MNLNDRAATIRYIREFYGEEFTKNEEWIEHVWNTKVKNYIEDANKRVIGRSWLQVNDKKVQASSGIQR